MELGEGQQGRMKNTPIHDLFIRGSEIDTFGWRTRLATNFWTRSWFAAADGWTRLPRKVTRWPPGNVRSRTLADAYGRWFPVRGFCSFRVWPCQTVPQCDWAFTSLGIVPGPRTAAKSYSCKPTPAKVMYGANGGLLLGQRPRRWTNIIPALIALQFCVMWLHCSFASCVMHVWYKWYGWHNYVFNINSIISHCILGILYFIYILMHVIAPLE